MGVMGDGAVMVAGRRDHPEGIYVPAAQPSNKPTSSARRCAPLLKQLSIAPTGIPKPVMPNGAPHDGRRVPAGTPPRAARAVSGYSNLR